MLVSTHGRILRTDLVNKADVRKQPWNCLSEILQSLQANSLVTASWPILMINGKNYRPILRLSTVAEIRDKGRSEYKWQLGFSFERTVYLPQRRLREWLQCIDGCICQKSRRPNEVRIFLPLSRLPRSRTCCKKQNKLENLHSIKQNKR